VSSSLATVMRIASVAICLIVVASFTLFAVNQTSTASKHQQQELSEGAPVPATGATAPAGTATSKPAHESSLHKAVDEASNALTSPFSGVTAGSSSEWVIHGVNLLLVLVVYGFGLGFLARFIRVRL
jgi:hypothetical protein